MSIAPLSYCMNEDLAYLSWRMSNETSQGMKMLNFDLDLDS